MHPSTPHSDKIPIIKKDAVVSLSYTLKNDTGQELDKSSPDKPFAYLHGNRQIVPGLENALEGLAVGDKKKVTVSPAEGYGEFVAGLKMEIERSNFPKDVEIRTGMQFSAEVGGDHRVFTVTDVGGRQGESRRQPPAGRSDTSF